MEVGCRTYGFFEFFWAEIAQKLVCRPRPQNLQLWDHNFFHVKLYKILHKTSSYFKHLNNFWKSYEGLIPENCKITLQTYSFWYHLHIFPLRKTPFLEHLNSNISGTAGSNLKYKPIPKSSH